MIMDIQKIVIQKYDQDKGVVELVDVLEKGIQNLSIIGKEKEIANAYTIKLIEQKLPRRIMLKWLEEEDKSRDDDRFESLYKCLIRERKHAEKILQQKSERENEQPSKVRGRKTVNMVNEGTRINNNCILHQNSNHLTWKCRDFLSKTVVERAKLVKDYHASPLCLSLSHTGKPCPWKLKWDPCQVDGCTRFHSRLLHGSNPEISCHAKNKQQDEEDDLGGRTLLLTQSVKAGDNKIHTFCDSGSSISLTTKHSARKNKLKGIKVSYDLVTLGNVIKPQNTNLYEIPIEDREGQTYIIKAYEIDDICHEMETTNMGEIAKLFVKVNAKDVMRPQRKIELLIGMNYAHLHTRCIETMGNLVLHESR